MDDAEIKAELDQIDRAINDRDIVRVAGSIAVSLLSIANTLDKLQTMSELDMEAAIEEAIQSRSQDLADQIVADKSKRGFIGKRS